MVNKDCIHLDDDYYCKKISEWNPIICDDCALYVPYTETQLEIVKFRALMFCSMCQYFGGPCNSCDKGYAGYLKRFGKVESLVPVAEKAPKACKDCKCNKCGKCYLEEYETHNCWGCDDHNNFRKTCKSFKERNV